MPIVRERSEVLGIYREAADKGWVLPCFCTENLTTTEAILEAARRHGEASGITDLPIIVAITNLYDHRAQSCFYTHTRRWDIGMKLFLADLAVLAEPESPFGNLRIMIHLDHVQHDDDQELLGWDMRSFSSIMFDASKGPFEDNIRLTKAFVAAQGDLIVIEGACDEIMDAEGNQRSELTDPEKAERYALETGVDLVVANLGTEHRASGQELVYRGDYARRICEKIGTRIVLHGASSVPNARIADLFADGICKVNIWTALERDASPILLRDMIEHAVEVAGSSAAATMESEGLLGSACRVEGKSYIDYFTTVYRQTIVFQAMTEIVGSYLKLWYR